MRSYATIAAFVLAVPNMATAGPEQVTFPESFATSFVRYGAVNKPDREPPAIRFLYVNREALAQAEAGQPMPHGTVIVMEDHLAKLDDQGKPMITAGGDFIPTAEITNIFVQEKQEGWGAEYPAETRNGEWEYGWFLADGSPKPDATFDRCFECHKGVEDQDFNFTLSGFIGAIKGQ